MYVATYTDTATATFARPNNTTAYAAGQVVTNATPTNMTFANCARWGGGTGTLYGVSIFDLANQATKAQFELWLFSVNPAAVADGAAAAFSATEAKNVIYIATLQTTYVGNAGAGAAGNVNFQTPLIGQPYKCAGTDTNLYGVLVVRNAYTPVANESFTVQLAIAKD